MKLHITQRTQDCYIFTRCCTPFVSDMNCNMRTRSKSFEPWSGDADLYLIFRGNDRFISATSKGLRPFLERPVPIADFIKIIRNSSILFFCFAFEFFLLSCFIGSFILNWFSRLNANLEEETVSQAGIFTGTAQSHVNDTNWTGNELVEKQDFLF